MLCGKMGGIFVRGNRQKLTIGLLQDEMRGRRGSNLDGGVQPVFWGRWRRGCFGQRPAKWAPQAVRTIPQTFAASHHTAKVCMLGTSLDSSPYISELQRELLCFEKQSCRPQLSQSQEMMRSRTRGVELQKARLPTTMTTWDLSYPPRHPERNDGSCHMKGSTYQLFQSHLDTRNP